MLVLTRRQYWYSLEVNISKSYDFSQPGYSAHSKTVIVPCFLHSQTCYCIFIVRCRGRVHSINQSINQTYIAPISPAKPGSVARQPDQCSTAKSMKLFRNINRPWGVTLSMGGKAKSKRCVFSYFLKVATELAERTDSGRLFQRDVVQE